MSLVISATALILGVVNLFLVLRKKPVRAEKQKQNMPVVTGEPESVDPEETWQRIEALESRGTQQRRRHIPMAYMAGDIGNRRMKARRQKDGKGKEAAG